MIETRTTLGGLEAIAVGDPTRELAVVVLHGREMSAADLAPFAHSLGVPAYFVFPDAPLRSARGRTWWPVDSEMRIRRLSDGPMELSGMDPPGRSEARALLAGLCDAVVRPGARWVLVGFSQGGMLAMDYVLHGGRRPAALALLSSTRIALEDWTARGPALAGLPVLVAHGRGDRELAFAAGEKLRDFAGNFGADVRWLPYDGGHEIPLAVWRGLRKLLLEVSRS
jgi:phospholipase/carboxylesterase